MNSKLLYMSTKTPEEMVKKIKNIKYTYRILTDNVYKNIYIIGREKDFNDIKQAFYNEFGNDIIIHEFQNIETYYYYADLLAGDEPGDVYKGGGGFDPHRLREYNIFFENRRFGNMSEQMNMRITDMLVNNQYKEPIKEYIYVEKENKKEKEEEYPF